MQKKVRFLGLDVHAETIAVAVAEQDGEVRCLGVIPNRAESVRKLIRKLGAGAAFASLLRSGPDGLRSVLAVSRAGRGVHGGGADFGSGQGRRPGEDRPAGCGQAGALSSRGRFNWGVGP